MKGRFDMKTATMFLVSLAAACALAFDDVQVTFRGRLQKNGANPAAQTVDMTFRLYASKGSAQASWETTKSGVSVDSSGLFQVALRGDGLADAIDAGNANWIGVTIGNGKEQYPRQALLAAPRAEKAAVVGRLADSPSIKTAVVDRVEANALSVRSLSIAGGVTLSKSETPAAMEVAMTKSGHTLPVKGKVRLFSGASPRDMGTQTASGGGCSFGTASSSCAALFTSESSDVMPGMTLLFKKDETLAVPSTAALPDGTVVRCRVYSIGIE